MKIKPNYLFIPLITIIVALVGSSFTMTGDGSWYKEILKPDLTPPNWVFPIAWNTIFILTTISALIVWNKGPERKKFLWFFDMHKEDKTFIAIITLFLANAVLNVLWSYLFFGIHNILGAYIEIFFIEASLIALIILIFNKSKVASLLLLPYALWVGFATYLNYLILTLN